MMFNGGRASSTLVGLLWCVRGARRFCDGPLMRPVRHVSGKSDRVRRLPSRGTHIVVSPIALLFPLSVTKWRHGVHARHVPPARTALARGRTFLATEKITEP